MDAGWMLPGSVKEEPKGRPRSWKRFCTCVTTRSILGLFSSSSWALLLVSPPVVPSVDFAGGWPRDATLLFGGHAPYARCCSAASWAAWCGPSVAKGPAGAWSTWSRESGGGGVAVVPTIDSGSDGSAEVSCKSATRVRVS